MKTAVNRNAQDLATPNHVAIIMDGNGRWARARGFPRIEGHMQGAEAVRTAVESAIKNNVRYLTLYSFSSENWSRPRDEVDSLMSLLRKYLSSEISELYENGVRLRVIGDRTQLSTDIVRLIEDSESYTARNDRLDLILALSYGGRDELTTAARHLCEKVFAGELAPADITGDKFKQYLYTADIPDPDLLIRTGGEQRLSNFLLWQLAYSEFVFLDTHWPEFSAEDFEEALLEFGMRERRFGAMAT